MEKNNSSIKYVIIGYEVIHEYGYGGWTGRVEAKEENVATFDTRQMAVDYIEKSKLKNPKNRDRPFKKGSLLMNYESARVEEYYPEVLPHNPVI
jgi:hypothetical protein